MVLSSNAIIRTGVNTSNRFLRKARVPATIRAGIDNATAATTATSIATATTAGTTIISDPTRPIDISLCLSYQRWCHVKLIQNPPPTGSYHSESLSHRPYCTSSLIVRNQEHKEVIEERGSKSSASSTNSSQQNNNDNDHEVPRSQSSASPFSSEVSPVLDNNDTTTSHGRTRQKFIPRKAAVALTEKARTLFKQLVENHPSKDNVLLNYTQSSTGEPRMVFSFSFVATADLVQQDEGVSLEVDDEGKPKAPLEAVDDGLPKLYIHHNAFLKVLGATVDVDTTNITPILYDKEGFEMDANV